MSFLVTETGRLDTICAAQYRISRSQAARLIEAGLCLVDDVICTKVSYPLKAGQHVDLEIPPPQSSELQPEDMPIHILYEDKDIAVVEKPRGMVVHPASGIENGTLVNALLARLDNLSGIGGVKRPGIVHRLDKDTSGLLIIAKNDAAHLALSEDLAQRNMEKHYLAVVEGNMKEEKGHISAPIGRSKADRKKMAVTADGREAITEWRLVENLRGAALLDVHILTGRTHQIRVHMQSLHHPLAGDPIYGIKKGVNVPCLMLHAYSLCFIHPVSKIRMRFVLPPPGDFTEGFIRLRNGDKSFFPFSTETIIDTEGSPWN